MPFFTVRHSLTLLSLLLLVQLTVEGPLISGSQTPPSPPQITHIPMGTSLSVSTPVWTGSIQLLVLHLYLYFTHTCTSLPQVSHSPVTCVVFLQIPTILCCFRSVDSPCQQGSEHPAPLRGLWHWNGIWRRRGAGWGGGKLSPTGWGWDSPRIHFSLILTICVNADFIPVYSASGFNLLCSQLSSLVVMAPPKMCSQQPIRWRSGSLRMTPNMAEASKPTSPLGSTWVYRVRSKGWRCRDYNFY